MVHFTPWPPSISTVPVGVMLPPFTRTTTVKTSPTSEKSGSSEIISVVVVQISTLCGSFGQRWRDGRHPLHIPPEGSYLRRVSKRTSQLPEPLSPAVKVIVTVYICAGDMDQPGGLACCPAQVVHLECDSHPSLDLGRIGIIGSDDGSQWGPCTTPAVPARPRSARCRGWSWRSWLRLFYRKREPV